MTGDSRGDVLEGLQYHTPGPWRHHETGNESDYAPFEIVHLLDDGDEQIAVVCGRVEVAEPDARAIARVPDLIAEVKALREAMESLFPAEEGFTEAFDELAQRGLIVPVPADDAFREEWGGDTMYVWKWSPLALLPTTGEDG